MISPEQILVSTVPYEIVGTAARPDEKIAKSLGIDAEDLKRPPACRYLVTQHKKDDNKKKNNNNESSSLPIIGEQHQLASFDSIRMGEACELHMSFFAAGDNSLSCILTRCIFGEVSATA